MTDKIIIIGECMVELQKQGELYRQGFGGDTLNTALYLSRLTKHLPFTVRYATGLGVDEFSQQMLTQWQKEGIDTSLVFQSQTRLPGLYSIFTQPNGERHFYYWRNDSAAKYWLSEVDLDCLQLQFCQAKWLYLSGISLAILPDKEREILFDLLQKAKQGGTKIAFDNNYRPILWQSKTLTQQIYQRILSLTDIAFLTFDDEILLYGEHHIDACIQRTQGYGVPEIVIKRGAEPCIVVTDQYQQLAANKIDKVVDTTAAGDSFSAGYLAKRLAGGSVLQAIAQGHQLAGLVIQHKGAIIERPVMQHLIEQK
ncbi:2-keto-3-deoxygluconate kinase [Volucribacter psittacicida]|uniref:2-dehydro-3-deoxygluconokinase n=1 Tax=Volucribacter psittacicida TaxID=203482 RepID=A0A4R1FSJ9_9PAST|nr:sugar kinase [Volucribacter psittacicida]TCJ97977.1 2-keto-3-deoxygluconate kinase [Volucribacter psittacicida]